MGVEERREPIAIIGIGCRFPGAPNPPAFWRLLKQGIDSIREIPADRWDADEFYDSNPTRLGKMINRVGGFIDDVDKFDWRAFRILPREAQHMDPQHRLLLEVAWEALEDAGLPLEKVAGSRTGVFVGIMWNDYLRLQSRAWSKLNGYSVTGNAMAYAPNRISYVFDLKGPSMAIDSGCAASLASLHAACQSLWLGESTLALAGGVNVILSPDIPIMLSKAGLLSPEGRCKPLDATADGFVLGEGAGILVLKPFSQLSPSDRVYAFIRGTALNHNGRNEWIMATSPTAQETVIRDAYRTAGIDPRNVNYVELHGTGMLKGDATEVAALGKVVGTGRSEEHPCAIGSVKGNIGHLVSAAGIASVIKVALSLYQHEIPPTLHLQQVNPNIDLKRLGLQPQRTVGSWPKGPGASVAGITGISMTGVNSHVVLEGLAQNRDENLRRERSASRRTYILPLSTRSPKALLDLARLFKEFLIDDARSSALLVQDICYTAGARRSHHEYRLAVIGCSRQALAKSLESYLEGRLLPGMFFSRNNRSDEAEDQLDNYEPALREAVSRLLESRDEVGAILPLMTDDDDDRSTLLQALGALYVQGHSLDWTALYPSECRCVQLPTYPWQRERLWLEWLNDSRRDSVVRESEVRSVTDQSPLSCVDKTIAGERGASAIQAVDGLSRERSNGFFQRLTEAPVDQRRALLIAHLREQVVDVLGLDSPQSVKREQGLFDSGLNSLGVHTTSVDVRQPLKNLGLDSLMALELKHRMETDLAIVIPIAVFLQGPSIVQLTELLLDMLVKADPTQTVLPLAGGGSDKAVSTGDSLKKKDVQQLLSRLDQLSNEEVDLLLSRELFTNEVKQ